MDGNTQSISLQAPKPNLPDLPPGSRLEQQYQQPYREWLADRGPHTIGRMLRAVQPVVDKAVTSYVPGKPDPTIRGRAKVLAAKAIENYDPTRSQLQTHLYNNLKRLQRASAQQQQILSVPEQVALDNRKLAQTESELRDWLGRDPTDQEMADHSGLSLKRLAYVRQLQQPVPEGAFSQAAESGDENADFMPAVDKDDPRIWQELVYQDLNDTNRLIMEHMLGLHGAPVLPLKELARRLGMSPGRVSQRAQQIQRMLDMRDELDTGF